VIDSHQHFWTTSRSDYGWLAPDDPVLYRDFGPQDLTPLIAPKGIEQTVLVQAAPTVEETLYLLDIAQGTKWVAAVVGWVGLDEPGLEQVLDELAAQPAFRGVRPMIQDIADDAWMLGERVSTGLRALQARGLSFDALVHPRHLSRLLVLLERHPDLRVVIDHAAKPEIRTRSFDEWAAGIARIAAETRASCKLSGLVTEAGPSWQSDDLRPYVAHLVECFGAERLMWGSDWPVVELAGGFDRWWETTEALLAGLSDNERASILGGTAARFYRIDSTLTTTHGELDATET
jgi:L-fuconolactonase